MNIDVVKEVAGFFSISIDEAMKRLQNSYQYYIKEFEKYVGLDQTNFEEWYKRAEEWYKSTDAQIYEQTYCRYFLTPRYKIDNFVNLYYGRVLDFGCGIGRVGLRALKLKKCKSIDFLDVGLTKKFVEYLIKVRELKKGCKVIDEPTEKYDIIVVSHILEHVDKPIELAQWLKTFLTSDGKFIGEAPFGELDSICPSHIKKFGALSFKLILDLAGVPESQITEIDFKNGGVCEEGEYE